MKFIAIFLLYASSTMAYSIRSSGCPEPKPTAKPFDVVKYLGNWYEIERSQTPHEDGVRCNTANYARNEAGGVNITNSGIDNTGHATAIALVAFQPRKDIPNFFSVTLSPQLPPATYWIVDTDFENFSAVACCYQITSDVQVFLGYVLSRERTIDEQLKGRLESLLYSEGVTQMYTTDQTNCD